MATGADTQRYNPEVPLEADQFGRSTRLNELADKLIKLRNTIEVSGSALYANAIGRWFCLDRRTTAGRATRIRASIFIRFIVFIKPTPKKN